MSLMGPKAMFAWSFATVCFAAVAVLRLAELDAQERALNVRGDEYAGAFKATGLL